jgi:hypothetical protein
MSATGRRTCPCTSDPCVLAKHTFRIDGVAQATVEKIRVQKARRQLIHREPRALNALTNGRSSWRRTASSTISARRGTVSRSFGRTRAALRAAANDIYLTPSSSSIRPQRRSNVLIAAGGLGRQLKGWRTDAKKPRRVARGNHPQTTRLAMVRPSRLAVSGAERRAS